MNSLILYKIFFIFRKVNNITSVLNSAFLVVADLNGVGFAAAILK